MTTVVLLTRDADLIGELQAAFAAHAPQLTVVTQDDARASTATVAACWFPPVGSLAALPRLQLVHSVAAGVEHLVAAGPYPALPVCRVVDPAHRQGMLEYMRWAVLHYQRGFDQVLAHQPSQTWRRPPQVPAGDYRVGVMGLGSLGAAVAEDLADAGYAVRGWARTPKYLRGVDCQAGDAALSRFLDGLDLLINLLPLTPATAGILGHATFTQLARGAVIVNGGRGGHLDAQALATALSEGQVRAALLDVFTHEPLPATDPLWHLPGVTVTPHMASAASYPCIATQVAENTRRLAAGEPLLHTVDPALGY